MLNFLRRTAKKYSKEEIENYVKNKTLNRTGFGFEHALQTYKLAKKLGSKYDDEILHAACLLHHIEQGMNYEGKSAQHADVLLRRYMNEADRFRVKQAILNHAVLGRPKSVEEILTHDASLLNSLGVVGMLQLTAAHVEAKDKLKLGEIVQKIKNIRKIVPEKLVLKQSISLAAEKIELMDLAIDMLEKEL